MIVTVSIGKGQRAYLSTIKDGSTNEILDYHVSERITMDLAIETLLKLKKNRSFKKTSEALIHSDQGTHYTHPDYRQLDQLQSFGCERFYQEKITGSKKERPELEKMLDHLRSGDTVVICELTRLSRSTKDLFQLVELIEKNGANIKSLKETWLDTTTPQGKLMFTIFAGISQFERDLISQRTKEGLDSARARGRKGGRPPKNSNDIEKAIKLYRSKDYSLKEINEMTGISKTSLYRYLELQAREFKQKS